MNNMENYAKEHDLDLQYAEKEFGLNYDENRFHLPVKDFDGNVAFTKTRYFDCEKGPKYKNSLGAKVTLFNYLNIKDKQSIVICEGEIDCIKLMQEGIPAVSSTGGAGIFVDTWVDLLASKDIALCYDNDDAGRSATRKLFEKFPNAKAIELPKNVKDVCEYFVAGNDSSGFLKLKCLTVQEWKTVNRPKEHNIITAGDLEVMKIPEFSWLIENIIYSEGFAFIYGAEGTGKSYIALSMAKAIITGKPWLDKFPTRKGNVLFLDKENPTSMIKKRLKGLGMTKKYLGDDVENIHWLEYPEKFQLSDFEGGASDFALALSEIVVEKEIDLIIIDSFVDLVVGSENSSADTQAFFNAIRELFPQIAYLPLHHENKPSQGVSRSDSQRMRGSSNINAQTFTMFRLEAVAKSKTEMTLKQTKARDSLKLDKFMIRMRIKPLLNGQTTVSGFEYMGEVEDTDDASKSGEVREAINNLISEKGNVGRKDILTAGIGSERTIQRVLKSMLETGEIAETRKGREKIYSASMFKKNEEIEDLDSVISEFDGKL